MITHYILVDFENVQPKAEDWLRLDRNFIQTMVFVNHKQKLSIDRVKALQALGKNVQYIEMTGQSKNGLDFLIAFYIGKILAQNDKARLWVISKDTGYDPLIAHLKTENGPLIERVDCVSLIQTTAAKPSSIKQNAAAICMKLLEPSEGKPENLAALKKFISDALYMESISEQQLSGLINFMTSKCLLKLDSGNTINYLYDHLPEGAAGIFPYKAITEKDNARLELIRLNLQKRRGQPKTVKTLTAIIKQLLEKEALQDSQIQKLISLMEQHRWISISSAGKLSYNSPDKHC